VAGVGAYARVRKQFKVPIAEFGGIQEALGRCGREAYAVMAGVELTNAIIDNHEAPMVLSSIMKQTCTERGRKVVQDGWTSWAAPASAAARPTSSATRG